MTMRYPQGEQIGDVGVVYEFNVKLPVLYPHVPLLTDELLEQESKQRVEEFAAKLRRRYSWVGEVGLTGRSNGWLAVTDAKGGATLAKLETIHGLVDRELDRFVSDLEAAYGKPEIPSLTTPNMKARYAFFRDYGTQRVGLHAVDAADLARAEYVAELLDWTVEWTEDPDGADTLGDIDPATVTDILVAVLRDADGRALDSLGGIVDPDRDYRRMVAAELAFQALETKEIL